MNRTYSLSEEEFHKLHQRSAAAHHLHPENDFLVFRGDW